MISSYDKKEYNNLKYGDVVTHCTYRGYYIVHDTFDDEWINCQSLNSLGQETDFGYIHNNWEYEYCTKVSDETILNAVHFVIKKSESISNPDEFVGGVEYYSSKEKENKVPSYDEAATVWNICNEYHSKIINEGWTWDGAVEFIQKNWNNPDLQIKKENLKMKENIFENAKFGDKFAIQYTKIPFVVFLHEGYISDDSKEPDEYRCANNEWSPSVLCYDKTGKCLNAGTRYNIVSRYQEDIDIDEEVLNDIASEYAIKADVEAHSMIINQGMSESTARFNVVCEAYKAGYRKAKDE